MTLRAAAEQALDTLEHVQAHIGRYDPPVVTTIARAMQPTIDALRAALAAEQPQPEAVAWPKVNGTARMFDNARALMVIMEREPTDDEMRAFDDAIKGWAAPPPAAEPSEASANERRLRRLLCAARHRHSAYMDDGEASDCSVHPSIDYLRDSLDEIEAKWRMRASATPAAPTEPGEAQDAARYRWLRDSEEGVEFRDGRGRWRADCPSGADLDAAIDAALRAAAAARKA